MKSKFKHRGIQDAINGHELLVAVILAETGIMAVEPIHPRKLVELVARAIEPIIMNNHTNWVDDYNILDYEVGDSVITIRCERKADLYIIQNIQEAMHLLSQHGAENVSTYLERAIYPAITAMLTLNNRFRDLICKMIEQEDSEVMRRRMKMDIARMTKQLVQL